VNELQQQFITEARELVDQATDDLIALEREGASVERIDRIFRAFHTLKGSAGVVELPAMSLTLHAAEELLSAIHAGRLEPTSAIVDQALACLDQVAGWIDHFETQQALPSRAGEDARAMAERLRDLLPRDLLSDEPFTGQEGPKATAVATSADEGKLPEWVIRLTSSAGGSPRFEELPPIILAVSYEPRSGCFFDGDDPLHILRQIPDLLAVHIEARDAWPPLAGLDPYACNLRLQCLSAGSRVELSNLFRLVPDQVRIIDVPSSALRPEPRAQGEQDTAMLVWTVVEEQRRMLRVTGRAVGAVGRIGAAARVAANALRRGPRPDLAERIELAGAKATAQGDAAGLLLVLDEILKQPSSHARVAEGEVARSEEPAGSTTAGTGHSARRSLRVDESKIDALINLAGELVVVKNSFAHVARRLEAEIGGRDLARAIRRDHDAIERLASEMHAAILQLRMVPVGQVFRSFPRLIRDMSRQLGKDATLVTHGEATECDKTIIDLLFEPLMHLVRNALDHGIESPEQRRSAGKPEMATVTMQASRAGDRFVVEVIDDGRGIDPDTVRGKARERGLLGDHELAAIPDEQAVELIFAAGFSTAAEVSDISGRGVGMDVVRATVERIGGRVSLASRVGAGTTIRLDLPTTIALSRIMVVEAGGQLFGMPMDAVTETVRVTPDRINRIKTNEGFVWHDRVVPICSLAELMHLPKKPAPDLAARLLIVAETGGKLAAIEVDAIRDRLEAVLKPMQGLLSNARGYAGTTLMDGGVLLVLDLKEVLP
jgi:two-component system, chemotaxis family, sensor kinase CheA